MLVKYSIKYLNEDYKKPEHEDEPSTFKDEGIVAGADYNACVARLEEMYGKDNVFWFSFVPLVDVLTKADFECKMWDEEEE